MGVFSRHGGVGMGARTSAPRVTCARVSKSATRSQWAVAEISEQSACDAQIAIRSLSSCKQGLARSAFRGSELHVLFSSKSLPQASFRVWLLPISPLCHIRRRLLCFEAACVHRSGSLHMLKADEARRHVHHVLCQGYCRGAACSCFVVFCKSVIAGRLARTSPLEVSGIESTLCDALRVVVFCVTVCNFASHAVSACVIGLQRAQ